MTPVRAPRWALSFADLCLLLLGFFVILHARDSSPQALVGGMHAAFGGAPGAPMAVRADYRAAALFQPGEAVMLPRSRAALIAFGRRAAAAGKHIRIESSGTDSGSRRFDDWELGAARVAAVARAVRAGGVAEAKVSIAIAAPAEKAAPAGQRIALTLFTEK